MTDKQQVSNLVESARKSLKESDFERALSLAKEALLIDPNHVTALFVLGATQRRAGQSIDAEKTMLRVVDSVPQLAAAHQELGLNYLGRGQLKKAKKALSSVGEQALARAEAVWAAAPAPAPRPKKVASKAAAAAPAAPAPATESADAAPAKKKRPRPSQGQRDRAKWRAQREADAAAAAPSQPPEEEEAALECVPRKTPKPAPAPAPAPGPPPLAASFAAPVRPSARASACLSSKRKTMGFISEGLLMGRAGACCSRARTAAKPRERRAESRP